MSDGMIDYVYSYIYSDRPNERCRDKGFVERFSASYALGVKNIEKKEGKE